MNRLKLYETLLSTIKKIMKTFPMFGWTMKNQIEFKSCACVSSARLGGWEVIEMFAAFSSSLFCLTFLPLSHSHSHSLSFSLFHYISLSLLFTHSLSLSFTLSLSLNSLNFFNFRDFHLIIFVFQFSAPFHSFPVRLDWKEIHFDVFGKENFHRLRFCLIVF